MHVSWHAGAPHGVRQCFHTDAQACPNAGRVRGARPATPPGGQPRRGPARGWAASWPHAHAARARRTRTCSTICSGALRGSAGVASPSSPRISRCSASARLRACRRAGSSPRARATITSSSSPNAATFRRAPSGPASASLMMDVLMKLQAWLHEQPRTHQARRAPRSNAVLVERQHAPCAKVGLRRVNVKLAWLRPCVN